MDASQQIRRVWGRRKNRPLNPQRQSAMDDLYPKLSVMNSNLQQDASLQPNNLFNNHAPSWMEIGFGNGEHIIGLLEQNPEINLLGAEPFLNGMAAFLKDLPEALEPRVRVIMDDAMLLATSLADQSLERLYILNPDPWHKARHHKRRIVNASNLDVFARILKPGGQLIMTSDVPDLAEWMFTHAFKHPAFEWNAKNHQDWTQAPKDWLPTRYEVKGAKGAKKMSYLFFIRK